VHSAQKSGKIKQPAAQLFGKKPLEHTDFPLQSFANLDQPANA
jgi:hypothetical protein